MGAPVLLITGPFFGVTTAIAAAELKMVRLRHVQFWEQISSFTITESDCCLVAFEGIQAEVFSLICIAGFPDFAIEPECSDQQRQFLQAEWCSALYTYMDLGRRPLVNGRALGRMSSFPFGSQYLLPVIADCGWRCAPRPYHDENDFFLLLLGWRVFHATSASRVEISQALLGRTCSIMRSLELDFLILRAAMHMDGGVSIVGAHISPPPALPVSLWEIIWNELSIF